MFEDLVPSAPAQTPAPPPGLFDDLIPQSAAARTAPLADATSAGGAASPSAGLFDDLIPAGSAVAGTAGAISSETEPSVGSVLKQFAIGIPEGAMNMAGVASDAMNGRMLEHGIVSALFGEQAADEWAPTTSKLLHDALPAAVNPQNYPAHNFAERIARGVGEGMPAVAIPGGTIAGRILTQGLAGATGALAAEAVPEPYKDAAQFAGNLVGAGIPALRSAVLDAIKRVGVPPERIDPADIDGFARSVIRRADEYRGKPATANGESVPPRDAEHGGPGTNTQEGQGGTRGPTSGDPAIDQPPSNHPPDESGAGTTGPPPDQGQLPQNGAPSGAVSTFRGQQVADIPGDRLAGQPPELKQPPIGYDGEPVELHHEGQVQDGLIRALTQTDHRIGENFKKNHPNTGKKPSLIDRVLSRSFREGYWEQQSKEGKFDHLPKLSETQIEELRRAARAQRKPRQR
jgi:hypothetical protein